MQKSSALTLLVEELREEGQASDVETLKTSKALIHPTTAAIEAEDGIELSAEECWLLFANKNTIERLIDALGAQSASLTLFDVTVPGHILEKLERSFATVDEG